MNAPEQLSLFEPEPSEVVPLIARHLERAKRSARLADALAARGMDVPARWQAADSAAHLREADDLAMFAQFCELAGVR